MFFYDIWYFILVVPAIIFCMWAQFRVKSTFGKFSEQRTGMTGADAAREVLRHAGLTDVRIERIAGELTDHFDPRENVIRLSESVHDARTVAAVGVAAHEAGHAIQYAENYSPMQVRAAIIPVTSFGSKLVTPLVLIGIFMGLTGFIYLGIILFASVVLFQLVTLPVEFNASSRAISIIDNAGILTGYESEGARKVLNAAALTYVGALALSLMQLIHMITIAKRR